MIVGGIYAVIPGKLYSKNFFCFFLASSNPSLSIKKSFLNNIANSVCVWHTIVAFLFFKGLDRANYPK